MATNVPSEDVEQQRFVAWLDEQGIPYWHTNNEMWTKSWKQKSRAKAMGVKSGIPDLFVVFQQGLVGIEMKRSKNGVVSETQKYWAFILEAAGVPVYVCRGKDHAVDTVTKLLSEGYTKLPSEVIKNAEKFSKKRQKRRKTTKKPKNDCPF